MEHGFISANNSASLVREAIPIRQSSFEEQSPEEIIPSPVLIIPSGDMLDLLRAIEMSRLQAVRELEQNIYRPTPSTNISTILQSPQASSRIEESQYAVKSPVCANDEQIICDQVPGLSPVYQSIRSFFLSYQK